MKMIGFKFKLLNATLAITAAIPLAAAGFFTSVGSAQAAEFSGGFNYTPYTTPGGLLPSVVVSNDSLKFLPNSGADLILSLQNGTFGPVADPAFNIAKIYNVTSPYGSLFLDLGKYNDVNNTSSDGKNVFVLESLTAPILSNINGVTGVVNFKGYFTDAIGSLTKTEGLGHLNFSVNTETSYETALGYLTDNDPSTVVNASFTGVAFTSVPEPAALLGLGAVGAVMAMSRRRKSFVQ
ncbi:PEP-CTERM sorting domain-containing protein [Nostoc sp.]